MKLCKVWSRRLDNYIDDLSFDIPEDVIGGLVFDGMNRTVELSQKWTGFCGTPSFFPRVTRTTCRREPLRFPRSERRSFDYSTN